MSTPAIIAYANHEGVDYIYCGHDGDYGYVGRLLLGYYNTPKAAIDLVGKNNITGLSEYPGDVESYASLTPDPAEKEEEATLHVESVEAMLNAIHTGYGTMNYIYLWDFSLGLWVTATGLSYHDPRWRSLGEVIAEIDREHVLSRRLLPLQAVTVPLDDSETPKPQPGVIGVATTAELFDALKARLVNEAKVLPYPDPSGEGRQRARVLAHLEDAWAIMNTYVYGGKPDASK